MNKRMLLSFILSGYIYAGSFYYMNYEQNGKKGTSEITKDDYDKVVKQGKKFFLDENNELIKVIDVYKNDYIDYDDYKKEQKVIKSKTQAVHKANIKEEIKETDQTISNSNFNIKEHITAHRVFIFIIVLVFGYKFLKKKTKSIEEHQEPVVKQVDKNKIEAVASENKDNFDYKELDEKRKKIYNNFKSDTRFEKEKKKLIYRRLSQLRKDIISKENLTNLNQELKEIEEVINNG